MNDPNPYAPPVAVVSDVGVGHEGEAGYTPFFAVSTFKLALLSVCSLGLYEMYWFYKNWKLIRDRGQPQIMPFWRAFFGLFFCYACFARIRDHGRSAGVVPPLSAGGWAAGWIIASLFRNATGGFWLISMLSFVCLIQVQAHVNSINEAEAPGHDPNSRLTGWNWVLVVLGGGTWLMALAGVFLNY